MSETLYIFTEDYFFSAKIKRKLKKVLGKDFGGPKMVLQSLTAGLTKLGIGFKVNSKIIPVSATAVVLSGPKILKKLILQKQQGKIKTLFAGPNVVQTPKDYNSLMASPEVDRCLVPSEQVKAAYERYSPQLRGRIDIWYTGVNEEFWRPSEGQTPKKDILIYQKNAPEELVLKVENSIKNLGFNPLRINYGSYSPEQYKNFLQQCKLAIFFSQSESQGIALAEAWAMNVPSLVWNPHKPHPHFPDLIDNPAPFLSGATGKFWSSVNELELQVMDPKISESFNPRRWVLENMTDAVSAKMLLELLEK